MTNLNLIVLYSNDLNRACSFYQSLGVEFIVEQHGRGQRHYACQMDGIVLMLYPKMQERTERTAYGAATLGFDVDNLDARLENVEKKYIYAPPTQRTYGRLAFLQDPDGRKIILLEKKKK